MRGSSRPLRGIARQAPRRAVASRSRARAARPPFSPLSPSSLTDLSWEQDGKSIKLHGFEIAALANLVQEDTDVEEIVALVPSLSRFEQRQTQEMLEIVSRCGANAAKAAAEEDEADADDAAADADGAAAAADDAPAEGVATVTDDEGMDVETRPPEATPSDAPAEGP